MRLLDHASNVHSQTGEDGILARIIELLPNTDRWCVEFGAWDGQHLSNTCDLVDRKGYSAVLIEADEARFKDLLKRQAANPKIVGLRKFVGFGPSDNLDVLLAGTPIPKDFDLLSVDIDGNDYHVWKAMSTYAPKVVCIEYNPTIPTEVDFAQVADPRINQGASIRALCRLGKEKGYELVAATQLNAIFVRAEFFPLFDIADNDPRLLREDVEESVTHVFAGYDGTVFVVGRGILPWHGVRYLGRIRQLPRCFRKFPSNYGPLRTFAFRAWRELSRLVGRA